MIRRSLDPEARWEWTPPGQDAVPESHRVVCVCRFPVTRQYLRIVALREESQTAPSDAVYVEKLLAALSIVVVSVSIGGKSYSGADALLDAATPIVLWEWVVDLARSCQAAESDLGKSQLPPHGGAARSARVAVAAGSNEADHA